MSRFRMLSHVVWHCQYHIIWTPKYRYRILADEIAREVDQCIRMYTENLKCEIIELNIQKDHIHLLVMIPPKVSISQYMGTIKGKAAIRVFKQFPKLKEKPYWGNHFWARGYCVDTIGFDPEKIRKYVKYQEHKEKLSEKKQQPKKR